jgi:cell division protein FtsI (penicillin-binding protein 3)
MKAALRYDDNPCRPRHFVPPCAPAAPEGPVARTLEIGRTRLSIAAAMFALVFLVIGIRLVDVTLLKPRDKSAAQSRPPVAEMNRADIVDRNGLLVATTLVTPSLYANPKQILDPADAAKQLVKALPDLDEAEVRAKLQSDRSFVWLKRRLTPREQFEVNRLGIPGFQFEREERRVYPHGNLVAHVVGYSSIDNKGLAGVERGLDEALKSNTDEPLKLSIDLRLQHILHEELSRGVADFNAIGGTGIVMDVRTGEVLAMVSLPDFDPNVPGTAKPERIFNRATLGTYEMGSTFKIFNTAMVLENKVGTVGSMYDVSKKIHIGRFTISDYHSINHPITMAEVFMHSSNIGSVRMALDAGTDRQKEFFHRLGMTKALHFEIPEVGTPLVPSPWREVNTMTIAFGHGMSVTPMHVATGVSAIINGGILHPPTLVKQPEGIVPAGQRVISEKTSFEMRRLLRLVVEQGTGSKAAAPGYVVGGKTGTAEKVSGHSYAKKALLSSFVGAFPIQDPKYLVLAMVDEPHGNKKSFGFATGGWVAAPIVSRIVQRSAPILGVPAVDENSPEIHRLLDIPLPALQVKKVASH